MRLFTALLCLFCSMGASFAQVGTGVDTGHAKSRLVAATMAAAPGETVTIALVQNLEKGWHVYWQNPGDSGLPLRLDWVLPADYSAGSIAYPLPHRLPFGPLMNYGHEGDVTFLVELAVPDHAVPGTNATISVDASWLICKTLCVPESATLRLLLPIESETGMPTIGYADRIAAARASQPTPAPFKTRYFATDAGPVLEIIGGPTGSVEFYPFAPSLIEPAADVKETRLGGVRELSFEPGFTYETARPENLSGVLITTIDGDRIGYTVRAPRHERPPAPLASATGNPKVLQTGDQLLLLTIVLAILGGFILNFMPCVFPIVFLKAAGFAATPKDRRGVIRRHGILYTVGVLTAFAILAGLLMVLRAGGEQLGWGFHLQSPIAVGSFAIIFFVIGLNLAGVFEIGTSAQGIGNELTQRGGDAGAFFTGLLAVAVAAPCMSPFLGGAVGLALSRDSYVGMLIFLSIGFGLALPYLLISIFPGAARILPRPGAWMIIAKMVFAFAMFATVVLLAWVLSIQAGSGGVLALGIGLVGIGFAAWLFGLSQTMSRGGIIVRGLALAIGIAALMPIVGLKPVAAVIPVGGQAGRLLPVPYNADTLAALRADGVPVFVDFTAAWCMTCQFNKKTVLETSQVAAAFKEAGVTYMVADWTVRDPAITVALEAQGRAAVPLYLYYAPGEPEPEILPVLLNKDMVVALF